MGIKTGILNCYSDEPKSAPSANYFRQYVNNADIINICHSDKLTNLDKYDGYIISGSRSSYQDEVDWIRYLEYLIKQLYFKRIPCLAVCFGHQLVAKIFGGKTIVNSNGEEGFKDIPIKDKINLFKNLPNPVKIYQSHHDAVLEPPPGSIDFISNDRCVQYYQYGSIYSIQSHPEISVTNAKAIAIREKQEIDLILNGVNDKNIESHIVLTNFVRIIEQMKK